MVLPTFSHGLSCLLVRPHFGVCSCCQLNSRVQACRIHLPKGQSTQPLSFARPTSADTLRHPIRIDSHRDTPRHRGTCPLGCSSAKHLRLYAVSCESVCNHRNSTDVLHAHRSGFDQYRVVELRFCSGSITPFLPFAHSSREDKHIEVRGNEV